ncbi:MAG TPA: hypothetical protein PKM43_18220 [Verrucomicrobiota bacterium]|nr:hypothetical protein [Verrucomicrobiota bacterium]HRZ35092.1 hypothetical protein [Candidatus Paceibacterota bacterium]HRZ54640.1 hypothetical protein [Candidatus Paceibacterota bacterium]
MKVSPHPDPLRASSYYPPRAKWGAKLARPARHWGSKFERLARRLPAPQALCRHAVCLLAPGVSFSLGGWRGLGLCILAGWLAALVLYLVCLGSSVANWAIMLMIAAHTASVAHRFQPWLLQQRLPAQIGIGMSLFAVVSFFVYVPARDGFERYVATPLPAAGRVVVVDPRVRPGSIQRGDWLAYRIEGSYANGVQIRAGFGFGPVLAVPGDRVAFGERVFRVNDTVGLRLTHMPRMGELVIAPERWLVWPDVDVSMHGVDEDVAVQAVLNVALPRRSDLVGQPYRHWFFRKQSAP